MIKRIFDTDHISLLERGHPAIQIRLTSVPSNTLAVSVITVEEMLRGRLAVLSKRSKGERRVHAYKKLMETVKFFSTITTIPFDLSCEQKFQELRKQKIRIGSQDLRIAATAIVNVLVVVTRNQRDFGEVPGLILEDWTVT
ncbi:MAG: type II toxin-antitoxin system VapC family toxin [Desulfobacterales bacterium]|nr:type II toxin-antitoxin system VapC family toxin [Desulfobacterales bacterium]